MTTNMVIKTTKFNFKDDLVLQTPLGTAGEYGQVYLRIMKAGPAIARVYFVNIDQLGQCNEVDIPDGITIYDNTNRVKCVSMRSGTTIENQGGSSAVDLVSYPGNTMNGSKVYDMDVCIDKTDVGPNPMFPFYVLCWTCNYTVKFHDTVVFELVADRQWTIISDKW